MTPSSSIPHELDPAPESEPHKEKMSDLFKEFSDKLATLPTPEEKIDLGLQFMRQTVSQEGSPRFREFWEARRLVLPFFKENLNPAIRSKLWGEYVELTVEARRLKEILEEQSAFAMEQIDLAIQAIEADIGGFESLLANSGDVEFPRGTSAKTDLYNKLQRELNLLSTLASRLNSLRKEVIKTDMRIRFKSKFFKRLSELGDKVFPRRKELIDAVSDAFENEIEGFINRYFKDGEVAGAPYYALREEIKSLQGMAKALTLNSATFNRTRLKLSECWDKVKVLEKEHKKEVFQKKQASSEQRQALSLKIEELKARSAEMQLKDLDKEINEIVNEMRNVSLHRDDVRYLRDELHQIRAPHLAAQELKARELEAAANEKIRQKKEKVAFVKERIAHLQKQGEAMDLEVFSASLKELQGDIQDLEINKIERQQLERSLKFIKDMLADKKESSLLNLSEDDKKTLENLRLVLTQKKERRQEIKEQLESCRKTLGGSGLDFEKAMQMQELVEQEKERLEKANAGIEEIEQKIAELEG